MLTQRSMVFGSVDNAVARERTVCPVVIIAERKRSLGMGTFYRTGPCRRGRERKKPTLPAHTVRAG
ncbi:hypothetical protein Nans01_33510 [Nocardiopsis ansamitocini]|uniref:Uncharacterized protein n=1 Tax=Nocardiopsis ansamitocini TaxID=1670832 RepID=A0A9W6P7M7_9ACTN|nr:hypothetical protein Nans01_33510 [Nocardiopsis ansamitocini]